MLVSSVWCVFCLVCRLEQHKEGDAALLPLLLCAGVLRRRAHQKIPNAVKLVVALKEKGSVIDLHLKN